VLARLSCTAGARLCLSCRYLQTLDEFTPISDRNGRDIGGLQETKNAGNAGVLIRA